jgi:hypothetical protein
MDLLCFIELQKTINYLSGGQGIAGSNPVVPTNKINKLQNQDFCKM